ncbi:MAG: hypothetical protein FWB85_01435 [Chitinispirillia bacterium]|nr:hypothetical protein [Chitinispirillia bacterium]MCL2241348.1 hypothetical protein [Chitinispirillia bacterium]
MARHSSNPNHGTAAAALAAAMLLTLLAVSCDLFLPPTGLPEEGPNIRSTPRGTIEHLFRAYEDKRIDLFTELLPKNGTYRFFISPDYSDAYAAMHPTDATITRIEEAEYYYVKPGSYHYWGHESELAKHRRLFNMADAIEFNEYPIIDERDFRYTVSDGFDTTRVEVKITAGELCISFRDTLYCTQKDGQMQVFLLERETDRKTGDKLWVIKDWFDLNTI